LIERRKTMQLTLKWWQARLLRDQLDAGLEAVKLGRCGRMVTSNECTVQWDSKEVIVEVPPEEDETKEA